MAVWEKTLVPSAVKPCCSSESQYGLNCKGGANGSNAQNYGIDFVDVFSNWLVDAE